MSLQILKLNSGADRRLRAGHLWIYSNEINNKVTPLKQFVAGEQVVVESHQGKSLGIAYVNPNTLICARIVSRDLKYRLNKSLIIHRLKIALSLRERCFSNSCYRLVYGDSDNLSGLVIDRFDNIFVVQISTAGMEAVSEDIIAALNKLFPRCSILLRNDSRMRNTEGLETCIELVQGDIPELCPLIENNTSLVAPLQTGQKTGWFYDHRINRNNMQLLVKDKRVLDLFSYVGGWGIQALAAGASQTTCVDASHYALEIAAENARINQVESKFEGFHGDAFDICRDLIADKEKFDLVVLDPPAFIQKKKDIRNGERAYERMNNFAMRLLNKDGILISASCSMHLQPDRLVDIIRNNSRQLDRNASIFQQGHQAADHPVHPAIPETNYLKAFFVRVLPAY